MENTAYISQSTLPYKVKYLFSFNNFFFKYSSEHEKDVVTCQSLNIL